MAVGGDLVTGDLVAKKFQAEPRGLTRGWQEVFEHAEPQIDVAIGQPVGQRPLKIQAQQARRDNDGQGGERAARFPPLGNFLRQGRLQYRLERADVDFAWYWRAKIASRTHCA